MGLTDNFSARVVMRAETAAGPVRWANVHELRGTGWTGDLFVYQEGVVDALVAFHRSLLMTTFIVEQVTLSSSAEDSKPYNPETLYAKTVMLAGTRTGQSFDVTVLPLTNCFLVKRHSDTGREGNILLRGYLVEQDIASDPMTGATYMPDLHSHGQLIAGYWDTLKAALGAANTEMVMAKVEGGVTSQVRPVTALIAKGHTSKKLNNKYFDKAATPQPVEQLFQQLYDSYGAEVLGGVVQWLLENGGELPLLP